MTATGAATAPADIRCEGVLQLFPDGEVPVVALRNVDLDIDPGEVVAILGPSGSGKSTLLALLSGMLRPTAGRVAVAGHQLPDLEPPDLARLRATELALLLQEPLDNLLPYATAVQNIRFAQRGALRRGWPLRWTPEELLTLTGLDEVRGAPMHMLPGGAQQQVALATVLGTSPRVILADEPTAHLDPAGRDAVVAALLRAAELSGATMVVVTHDPVVAAAMPRTVTIRDGQVSGEGRRGDEYVVIGRDGSLRLPPEVVARHPAGTLLRVRMSATGIELLPRGQEER